MLGVEVKHKLDVVRSVFAFGKLTRVLKVEDDYVVELLMAIDCGVRRNDLMLGQLVESRV